MSAILPGLQAFSSAFNRIAMKKLLYILAGLGLAACTSDIEELPEVGPQPGREVALTGISGTASRTQFVPGDGTEIQFQWSTGDRIWAGGVQSAEAGTDGNVADFGFTNLPGAAPYRIYYNMTGTDAEATQSGGASGESGAQYARNRIRCRSSAGNSGGGCTSIGREPSAHDTEGRSAEYTDSDSGKAFD